MLDTVHDTLRHKNRVLCKYVHRPKRYICLLIAIDYNLVCNAYVKNY
jgi:hypothetical protein